MDKNDNLFVTTCKERNLEEVEKYIKQDPEVDPFYFIVMCGLPGTGKTTIAKLLSDNFNFSLSSYDCHRYAEQYYPNMAPEEYCFNWFNDAILHSNKKSAVILDATFHNYLKRISLYKYMLKHHYQLILINLEADAQVLFNRLEHQRLNSIKIFHASVSSMLQEYINTYESPINDPELPIIININTVTYDYSIFNKKDLPLLADIDMFLFSKVMQLKAVDGIKN